MDDSDTTKTTEERALPAWADELQPEGMRRRLARLLEALDLHDEELGETDRRFLSWLADWDDGTEAAFYSVLSRSRVHAGALATWAEKRIQQLAPGATIWGETRYERTRIDLPERYYAAFGLWSVYGLDLWDALSNLERKLGPDGLSAAGLLALERLREVERDIAEERL